MNPDSTRPGPIVSPRAPVRQAVALELGAWPVGPRAVRFRVWAPRCRQVEIHLIGPSPRSLPLAPEAGGLFAATVGDAEPGIRYFYRLDGSRDRPDPVSRFQPDGVHDASAVVDPTAFSWTDAGWRGVPLSELCFYELHVGTFTPEGTFDAVIPYLDELRELGITAVELMPAAEFPGRRNWGYDGVHLFAPQSSYGGPDGLRRLVDAAHRVGLAVFLDVVYNHLGPEGNYLREYGPYFSNRHRTPWGEAVNYDGEGAEGVRRHVVGNACYWIREYHMDGLRLDAVHAIVDTSPTHILAELGAAVAEEARALGREVHVVAESNRNDRRIVVAREQGGYGLASQWSDDFHHSLRVTLTGVAGGYYEDFQGGLDDLEVAIREAFVYRGRFSRFREQVLGTPAADLPGEAFVIFDQNHDQIGNQAFGDRLTTQVTLPAVKVAAASVLLAPYLPLLFMGEEYGETAPFQFFTSFGDPSVVEAVRVGRRQEFAKFQWSGEIPDPEDPATFARSRLDRTGRERPPHAHVWAWYRALFGLRRSHAALRSPDRERSRALRSGRALALHRWSTGPAAAFAILSYDAGASQVQLPLPPGAWRLALDSEAPDFGGSQGSAAPSTLGEGPASFSLRPYQALVYIAGADRS